MSTLRGVFFFRLCLSLGGIAEGSLLGGAPGFLCAQSLGVRSPITPKTVNPDIEILESYLRAHPEDGPARFRLITLLRAEKTKELGPELTLAKEKPAGFPFAWRQEVSGPDFDEERDEALCDQLATQYRLLLQQGGWAAGNHVFEFLELAPWEARSPLVKAVFRAYYPEVKAALRSAPSHNATWAWYAWMGTVLNDRRAHLILDEVPLPKEGYGIVIPDYLLERARAASGWRHICAAIGGIAWSDEPKEATDGEPPSPELEAVQQMVFDSILAPYLTALAHLNQREEALAVIRVFIGGVSPKLGGAAKKILSDLGRGSWIDALKSTPPPRVRLPEKMDAPMLVFQGLPAPITGRTSPVRLRNLLQMDGVPDVFSARTGKITSSPSLIRQAWQTHLTWQSGESAWALVNPKGEILARGREALDAKNFEELLQRHEIYRNDVLLARRFAQQPDNLEVQYGLVSAQCDRAQGLGKENDPQVVLEAWEVFARSLKVFLGQKNWDLAVQGNSFTRKPLQPWLHQLPRLKSTPAVETAATTGVQQVVDALKKDPENPALWNLMARLHDAAPQMKMKDILENFSNRPACLSGQVPPSESIGYMLRALVKEQDWETMHDFLICRLLPKGGEPNPTNVNPLNFGSWACLLEAMLATERGLVADRWMDSFRRTDTGTANYLIEAAKVIGCRRVVERWEEMATD